MAQDERYPFRKSWRWHIVRLLDLIFDLFSSRLRKRVFPERVQKILVIKLDQIGDVVCSLPVFPILRRQFPNAKISALVGKEGEAILNRNPFVDEVITFRANWFARNSWFNPLEFARVLFTLKKKGFDLGFDLRGDLRNILLMTLAGVRYRVGYEIAGGGGLLHDMRPYDTRLHQVELNVRLVSNQVIGKTDLKPEIYLSEAERSQALRELRNHGAKEGGRLIAIHAEAGYPSKEWEEEKFEAFIKSLLSEPQNTILIFGISKARRLAEYFSNSDRVINLVSTLTLRQMIAMLSLCHLFIGNDSGPSHIAQALGIPVVVIASGTNEYEKWGVWTKRAAILKYLVPCSPCHLQYCNVEGHPCMSRISAEEVSEAARELMAGVV